MVKGTYLEFCYHLHVLNFEANKDKFDYLGMFWYVLILKACVEI